MPSSLQEELQQTKPFESLEVEVYLNMLRTHALLSLRHDQLLRSKSLTPVSYNILRILRGAGERGQPCTEISNRLLTRVPDVTRLVDRLVKEGLVRRYRTEADRRMVYQVLTPKAHELLAELDGPLSEIQNEQLSHMTNEELGTLNELLVKARANVRR